MLDATHASAAPQSAAEAAARVLVCAVDRGLFGVQATRVEAVYPVASTAAYWLRSAGGERRAYIVHDGQPAVVVDPREALGLADVLGGATRDAYLVLHAGPLLLALPVDHCVGIRTLDLASQRPVASGLQRDDGLPLGHLVALDGRMLVVLDPARLLDARLRDALLPVARRARGACDRLRRLDAAWQELRETPSAALLRTYAGLCQRSGRTRAAAATRLVLACLPEATDGGAPEPAHELPRRLLALAAARRSGRLSVRAGETSGAVELVDGRLAAVEAGPLAGRAALAALLSGAPAEATFADAAAAEASGPLDSIAAAIIAALEAQPAARRRRTA